MVDYRASIFTALLVNAGVLHVGPLAAQDTKQRWRVSGALARAVSLLVVISVSLSGLGGTEVQATPAQLTETVAFEVREARIPSEPGVVLAATLRLPEGHGPHPVLIIHSGQRGGYAMLERRLNEAGIATIEFDKRGAGQSTGTLTNTMQDMEADLAATIVWLRARSEIDGARIALLGHSQHAAAIPAVAERDGHLAAIVLLASPVGERGTMFLDRMREQLVESGHARELAENVTAATQTWMELRSRGAPDAETASARASVAHTFDKAGFTVEEAEGATNVLDSAQLLSMYEAAPGTALAHLHIPVLAIFGARDEIVHDQTGNAAEALAENSDALVIEVPGANHGFGYRRADAPPRDSQRDGPWLSLLPDALITDWLRNRFVVP